MWKARPGRWAGDRGLEFKGGLGAEGAESSHLPRSSVSALHLPVAVVSTLVTKETPVEILIHQAGVGVPETELLNAVWTRVHQLRD